MLTIAVLTYNNHQQLLPECLSSIDNQLPMREHTKKQKEIKVNKMIIDNCADVPVKKIDGWKLIRLQKNVGNIGGQNRAFELALDDYVLFVSDDVRLTYGSLRQLWDSRNDSTQIAPIIINKNGTIQSGDTKIVWPFYGLSTRKATDRHMFVPYIPSICYLMTKRAWSQVCGFDESLPMAYEDVDFGLKQMFLNNRGRIITYATAIHLGNATLKYTKKDRWRFHQARLQVIRKHFSGWDRATRLAAVRFLDAIRGLLG